MRGEFVVKMSSDEREDAMALMNDVKELVRSEIIDKEEDPERKRKLWDLLADFGRLKRQLFQ